MKDAYTVTLVGSKKLDITDQLVSLTCTHEMNKVPSATVQLKAGDFAARKYPIFKNSDYAVGKPLEIGIRYEHKGSNDTSIFKGVITGIKFRKLQGAAIMVIKASDPAFRLKYGVSSEFFSKKSDKQMIEKVFGAFTGVSLKKAPGSFSSVQYDQFIKKQCSGWQFLQQRMAAHGLLMSFDNGALTAWTPGETQGELNIEVGIKEVLDLSIEENGLHLNQQVKLAYWDTGKDGLDTLPKKLAGKLAKEVKAPDSGYVCAGLTVKSQANALLTYFETQQALEQYRGFIKIQGESKAKVMQKLTLKGLPAAFNKSYTVTGVTHKVQNRFWSTRIGVGQASLQGKGDLPDSLSGSVGLEIGLATAMKWEKDPKSLGRVPVQVMGFGKEKYWAYPAQLAAGAKQRSFKLPEQGEKLILGFMHGSYSQGMILTSLYFKDKLLKSPFKMDAKSPIGLISSSDMQLIFDDDKKDLKLATPKNNTLVLNDSKGTNLNSKKDIQLSTNTKFDMKANATVKIKGKSIDLN